MKTVFALIVIVAIISILTPALAEEPRFAFRGLWVDTGSFANQKTADRLLENCRRAKINNILVNVMVHGSLLHKSSHFMHKAVAEGSFDPLAYVTEKAHAMGIRVHAWYCVYYEGVKGLTPARPEWICADMNGSRMSETYFLSPQIPGVNDYLLSVIKDGLAYDVDGIHLDYIRYYGSGYDYSPQGREPFERLWGFDPIDFLDHSERIVPAEKDPFPVRVLRADRQLTRVWEATWTEGLMGRSGVGFGFISEKPANVDALRAPGVLVLCAYPRPNTEMLDAIERYVNRGGSLIWIDSPALDGDPRLARLLGVKPQHRGLDGRWHTLKPSGSHPLAARIPAATLRAAGTGAVAADAGTVVSRFDSGRPAVIANSPGGGRTVLVSFNACMATGTIGTAKMINGIVDWLREESGVRPCGDAMAEKREAWTSWRANRITDLVREVHDAVKAKSERLAISAAGGFGPAEHHVICRDGRSWLEEGLIDFASPMDYCDELIDLQHYLEEHRMDVPAESLKTFYPGLALYTTKVVDGKRKSASQDAGIVQDQLRLVRKMGYGGFALFCSAQLTDEQIKVIAEAAE